MLYNINIDKKILEGIIPEQIMLEPTPEIQNIVAISKYKIVFSSKKQFKIYVLDLK